MNMFVDVAEASETPASTAPSAPPAPTAIEETGLEAGFLLDLMVKTIYRLGLETQSEIARAMRLSVGVVSEIVEIALDQRLMETLGQRGASFAEEMRYALSTKGRDWALEALNQNEWFGPAPVTLEDFARQIRRQSIRNETLSRATLERVFADLTLPMGLMERLGPAANCAASVLLYGPPGNGKSSIAEAICEAFGGVVYFPHALVVDKQIVTVYDPTVHHQISDEELNGGAGVLRRETGGDRRYVACYRPAVVTGGELMLDKLDLALNTVSRVYEAPLQLKAAGGIFVVDDFGRQAQSPQALINRLIIPLESGRDFLALQTGRKFEVPFDSLVIFSTNVPPKQLVDDAALRRLRYKILVDRPDLDTFLQIFTRTAAKARLALDEETMVFILTELYGKTEGAEYAGFHPRFLIDQVKAICLFEGVTPQFRPEFLHRAWENLFTEE